MACAPSLRSAKRLFRALRVSSLHGQDSAGCGVEGRALQEGRCKIEALFDEAQAPAISEDELEAAGFSTSVFCNVNTREELEAAGKIDSFDRVTRIARGQ
jgi:hypothetical protein